MRRSLLGVVCLLLVGTAVGIHARPASAGLTPTAFTLHAQESGAVGYAVIGASELTETGGVGNCSRGSDAAATLSLPSGARVRRAYLSWYAMVMNTQEGTSTISPLDNTLVLNKPTNASVTVTASITQRETTGMAWRASFVYDAKIADVTSLLDVNAAAGVYRANVTGGWSEQACPYREENARAWTLHVIYEAPSITTPHAVSLWFGFNAFHLTSTNFTVTGFRVPSTGSTTGSLTYTAIQGDAGLPGEYLQTGGSDLTFPNAPSGWANSSTGGALDVDTLTGSFTPGTTSLRLTVGSDSDVITLTAIVIRVPTDLDFGDAPAGYELGLPAHHVANTSALRLGPTVDSEAQPASGVSAAGDNLVGVADEDAIASGAVVFAGPSVTVSTVVALSGATVGDSLCGWIDFDIDGVWTEAERACATLAAGQVSATLTWAVPPSAKSGDSYLRLRVADLATETLRPTGLATSGEVEDYPARLTGMSAAPPATTTTTTTPTTTTPTTTTPTTTTPTTTTTTTTTTTPTTTTTTTTIASVWGAPT